jgi:uncharacterized protein (DUF1684 family)
MSEARDESGIEHPLSLSDALEVADWRRRVAELYQCARDAAAPVDGWTMWRKGREQLFSEHPQSPLPRGKRSAAHLPSYFPYKPSLRVIALVEECPVEPVVLPSSSGESLSASRVGVMRFDIDGRACALMLYSLSGYAGGLFVSFRDAGSGAETYGSGRYLIDTVKGADLGTEDERMVLDFNFAYQPSCSYDDCWSCPLPPRENWLDVAVRAGERLRPPED